MKFKEIVKYFSKQRKKIGLCKASLKKQRDKKAKKRKQQRASRKRNRT